MLSLCPLSGRSGFRCVAFASGRAVEDGCRIAEPGIGRWRLWWCFTDNAILNFGFTFFILKGMYRYALVWARSPLLEEPYFRARITVSGRKTLIILLPERVRTNWSIRNLKGITPIFIGPQFKKFYRSFYRLCGYGRSVLSCIHPDEPRGASGWYPYNAGLSGRGSFSSLIFPPFALSNR